VTLFTYHVRAALQLPCCSSVFASTQLTRCALPAALVGRCCSPSARDSADCGKLLDGTQFDAADEFSFELGAGEVIKGWDKGCAGLRVGEAVKLTVPSKLGYGKRGSPPEIPPDATLVFDIVMKRIR
jgi:hypothetical protein